MRFFRFMKNVTRHWLVLLSCAVFTFLGAYTLHANQSNAWAEKAMYVAAGICLFISCFLAWNDKEKELHNVTLANHQFEDALRGQILALTLEREEGNPHLGLIVHEALLIPKENAADIFVDAEISNERAATTALVRSYEIRLEIGNKKYLTGRLIQDADSYESFNWGEEPEDGRLVERTWDHEALNDLSKEISAANPLINNLPRRGWLHFRLESLPAWPLMEQPTGEYEWEHATVDGDGDEISPPEAVEKTVSVVNPRAARYVALVLFSPGESSSTFTFPINHSGTRRIRRLETKPTRWLTKRNERLRFIRRCAAFRCPPKRVRSPGSSVFQAIDSVPQSAES